jgi:alpha-tubulin suppressor-like RCC1 family protein
VGFCWGLNRYGQLGNGEQGGNRNVPQAVAAGASLSLVVAGQMHTCSRTRDGRALCWGRNSNGQLGDGTQDDRSSPVQVRGAAGFAALQAGGGHTCGITSSGDAYCWGTNIDGQLGGGNRENAATPTRVTPVSR